ncbi:hypothetical protein MPER_12362 [Moniliophthora perniciosa FA553]|nr:hypothetical protein MPER_12362 [Moniliophthora perniciosa FA553]
MDPLPYNVTISAQSPAIAYDPSHDSDSTLEGGWNVTYTDGTALTLYGAQGVGDSSLQTTYDDASMALSWIGTAAYLYGNATTSEPYNIIIDGDDHNPIAQTYPGQ